MSDPCVDVASSSLAPHCAAVPAFVSGEELPLAEVEVPLNLGESNGNFCCTGSVMFFLAPPAPLATCEAMVGTRVDIALAQIMVVMHEESRSIEGRDGRQNENGVWKQMEKHEGRQK